MRSPTVRTSGPQAPVRAHARPAFPVILVLALAFLHSAGCGRQSPLYGMNTPPTLTITSGPVDTLTVPLHWIVEIAWTASDPDGHVDYFEYAVDPPTLKQATFAQAETSWVQTQETRATVRFRASEPDGRTPGATASSHHVFVLRAVDDRGGVSPLIVRAFYAYTVAPDVQITRPVPSQLLHAVVPAPFRIEWAGDDPDGYGTRQPASYRLRLLDASAVENMVFLVDPDSLLGHGAATGWADWREVPGTHISLVLTEADGLSVGLSGLLAMVAVDAAGATTPYLMFDRNFLRFTVTGTGVTGPLIHVFSPLVDYQYESGLWSVHPSREIPVNAAVGRQYEFNWDGQPMAGRALAHSRWMLDGDPFDETPRSSVSDLAHWSEPGPAASGVLLPPLSAGTHRLHIEIRDDFDDKSLGIVRIEVVTPALDRELLVVDDTRFEPDKFAGDPVGRQNPDNYTRPWPSATELDTFLFARGGVPWRGTRNPPQGVLSPPGLLSGYSFDTLGTRLGLENPAAGVPLGTLARYRHVLWIVDGQSSQNGPGQNQILFPMTALRAMSAPGRASALSQYVQFGGRLWLAGGGAAYASLIAFDVTSNNRGPFSCFTVADGELGPGRVLYDAGHVRNSLCVLRTVAVPQRSPRAVGGWAGHGPNGTIVAPDYAGLPAELPLRTPETDPIPPTRLASQGSLFYPVNSYNEYTGASEIVEDMDPDPEIVRLESTLDTLYEVTSTPLQIEHAPVMLYYHGRDNEPFVFTGLDLWTWPHADCQALVDFVLGDIWGLVKSGPGASSHARAANVRPTRGVTRQAAPVRPQATPNTRRP